jgi:hypothetical protein
MQRTYLTDDEIAAAHDAALDCTFPDYSIPFVRLTASTVLKDYMPVHYEQSVLDFLTAQLDTGKWLMDDEGICIANEGGTHANY